MASTIRRHTKSSGRKCDAPALRGMPCCYFHMKLHHALHQQQAAPPSGSAPGAEADTRIDFPVIEDRAAVKLALSPRSSRASVPTGSISAAQAASSTDSRSLLSSPKAKDTKPLTTRWGTSPSAGPAKNSDPPNTNATSTTTATNVPSPPKTNALTGTTPTRKKRNPPPPPRMTTMNKLSAQLPASDP